MVRRPHKTLRQGVAFRDAKNDRRFGNLYIDTWSSGLPENIILHVHCTLATGDRLRDLETESVNF